MAQDADGRSLWELTWSRARGISSGLQPQLLAASGVPYRLMLWHVCKTWICLAASGCDSALSGIETASHACKP